MFSTIKMNKKSFNDLINEYDFLQNCPFPMFSASKYDFNDINRIQYKIRGYVMDEVCPQKREMTNLIVIHRFLKLSNIHFLQEYVIR